MYHLICLLYCVLSVTSTLWWCIICTAWRLPRSESEQSTAGHPPGLSLSGPFAWCGRRPENDAWPMVLQTGTTAADPDSTATIFAS